jgi:pyridoxine 5-phosphate synthase
VTLLSVNVNKIAVLRNSRGGEEPGVGAAAATCIAAGAGGITVHPRPDQRHIRPGDVRELAALCAGLLALVAQTRPTQCTLVPDGDAQITSDHGFDLRADAPRLRPLVAELKSLGCRISLFMDAESADIERVAEIGADRVEIYTGPYAEAFARNDYRRELAACAQAAERALAVGLGVNAGHDLSQSNLAALKGAIPFLSEVSIGHALIGEALYAGLAPTVQAYLRLLG